MSLTNSFVILNNNSCNVATLNLILIEKILNVFWISKHKQHLSIYKEIKDKIYIRGFLTYTSFGSYCLFLLSLYEVLTKRRVSPELTNYCWSILFSVTSGYYLYLVPGVLKSPDPRNWFLNILCHGPYFIINTYKLFLGYPHSIHLSYYDEIKYCLMYSYGWVSLVWFPWYNLTGDYMYPPLSSNLSKKKRILNILKMSSLLIIGVTGKHLIYKVIKEK